MRFHVIPAIGIVSGLVMGCFQFQGSPGNVVSTYGRSLLKRAQKVVIQPLKEESFSDPGLTQLANDATETDGELVKAMESSSESRLRYKLTLLERGRSSLRRIADYTALMRKQEVVRGELLDEQTISIKCRHHPFSVYLAWEIGDAGREVIYVEGKNNGKLLAHDGGWKSRLPAFSMSTEGEMAMKDARCPVTTAGLLGLTDAMIAIHQHDLKQSDFASCEIEAGRQFDGRRCSMFTTKYKSAKDSPVYRKSITLIDHEWNLPVNTQHFEWCAKEKKLSDAELDRETLIESYSFTDIKLKCHLTDYDFDRTNKEYHFH